MPKNSALTSDELTALAAANDDCPVYLSFVPDTEIAHATVNGTPDTFPIVSLSTTAESAHWADGSVRVDSTVKITSSDGLTLRGYYRVRFSSPTAGTFFIDETSNADPGMIAQSSRTTGIVDGDLITAYERYDPWSVKPVTINTTEYQDYNQAVSTHNQYPDPIVNITFNGQNDMSHYLANVPSGGSATISAVASVQQWAADGGSLTYSWTAPSSWSSVAGTATDTLTATVPVGAYWLYLQVTSSAGGVTNVKRFVRVHDPSDPPVAINVTLDVRDRTSRKVTVRGVNARLSVVPDGALCFVWSDGTWNGVDVPSASHIFAGYAYRQPYSHVPGFYDMNLELLGTCAVLDIMNGLPAHWAYTGFLTEWTELSPFCTTVQFMMWWLLRWRTANILSVHNFTPFGILASRARRKQNSVDAGSVLSQLRYLAEQYDLNVGSRSSGEIICSQHPSMLVVRTSVVTRDTLNNSLYSDINVDWSRRPSEGLLTQSGIYCDLGFDYQVASAAPGVKAQGQGGRTRSPTNKVFESQSDANQRTGRQFALDNNPYPNINIDILKNRDVYEPVDMEIVTVQIPADKSPTGSAITLDTCPISVAKTYIPGRRASLRLTVEGITNGLDGETAAIPSSQQVSGDFSFTPPDVPESPGWGDENTNAPIDVPTLVTLSIDGYVARGN